jgi:hypothetical protein
MIITERCVQNLADWKQSLIRESAARRGDLRLEMP